MFNHVQLRENGIIVELVLRELGYTEAQIRELREKGIVGGRAE